MEVADCSGTPYRYQGVGRSKKALTGISQKVLTQHLRIMEENKRVHREVFAEVPPKVEYSLTEVGRSLKIIHDAMWQWGEAYKRTLEKAKPTDSENE